MSIELRKKIYKNLLQEIFGEALNSREELIGEIEEEYKRLNLLPLSRNLKYEGELIFIYRYGQLFHANKNKNFKEIFDKEQIYSGWKDVVLNTELPKLKETLAGYLNENARERLFGILRISSAPFILNLNDEKELVNVFSKLYLTVKYRDGMIGFMKKVLSIKLIDKIERGEIKNRKEKEREKLDLSKRLLILPPSDSEIVKFAKHFSSLDKNYLKKFFRIE